MFQPGGLVFQPIMFVFNLMESTVLVFQQELAHHRAVLVIRLMEFTFRLIVSMFKQTVSLNQLILPVFLLT